MGPTAAGLHQVTWDPRRDDGAPLGAGLNFARLALGAEVVLARLVVE